MKEQARSYFKEGYNCAQAVLIAACDRVGLDQDTAALVMEGFGGGFGRQREVCGAVSGAVAAIGMAHGSARADSDTEADVYARVQAFCNEFKEEMGSIICRELLGQPAGDPIPEPRTEQYYKQRPCAEIVATAAELLEKYL